MDDLVPTPHTEIEGAAKRLARAVAPIFLSGLCQVVVLAVAFVIMLFGVIAHKSYSAFTRHYLQVPMSTLSLNTEPTPTEISRALAQINLVANGSK